MQEDCPNFQKNCPYCLQGFKPTDNICLFSHDNPLSFHCVHKDCLSKLASSSSKFIVDRDIKCPSCNKLGTYRGWDNYAEISNALMVNFREYCGEANSFFRKEKKIEIFEIDDGDGIKRKKIKTKRNTKKSKKRKRRNKSF